MLRTMLVVMVLVWLLVASAIAFVPIATGQQGATGSLTATCDRDSVPRGVDTVVRCTCVATNDSDTDWNDASLTYEPLAGVATPARSFFFRVRQGGMVIAIDPSQTTFAFPRVDAQSSAQIQLEVIVNSLHDFGVNAELTAGTEGWWIDAVPQRWSAAGDAPDPPLYGSLVPIFRDDSADVSSSVASWVLVARNATGEDLADVKAEVFAPDYGLTSGLDSPQRSSVSVIEGGLGAVDAGGFIQRELRAETRGRCAYASPAMLLSATKRDGSVVTGAILPPDQGTTLNCQTLETPSFPAAGHELSPEGAATPLRPVPLALAACGGVLLLLGVAPLARRLRRRR